jgi:diguanylate cyclase (GGDEF)-like protein
MSFQKEQNNKILEMLSQKVKKTFELKETFEIVAQEIQGVLKCDRLFIYRWQEEADDRIVAESLGENIASIFDSYFEDISFDQSYLPRYLQGEIFNFNNLARDGIDFKSELALPILVNDMESENLFQKKLWGILAVHQCRDEREWTEGEIDLLKQVCEYLDFAIQQIEIYQQFKELNKQLQQLTIVDPTTKLANRHSFEDCLNFEWQRLIREQHPLSLIWGRIDEFELYQDTYGKIAKDSCLQLVADALRELAQRPSDLASRYSEEEFAILLPNTDLGGAAFVAEKIRCAVADMEIPHAPSATNQHITISFGVATTIPQREHSPEQLVEAAKNALEEAKILGSDRVVIASE